MPNIAKGHFPLGKRLLAEFAGQNSAGNFEALPANNDILLQFPYTKLTCVRILPLVNVLVLLGDELLAVILADVNTNLYLPTPESKLQLIGY